MRVKALGGAHFVGEGFAAVAQEAVDAEGEAGFSDFDVGPPAQRVLDDLLVFFDGDAARRVDDVAAGFAGVVDAVDGGKEELLLQVGHAHKVDGGLVRFHARVFGDDAGAGARGVEQHAVKAADDFGELVGVVVADDGVLGAEAVDVADQGFGPRFIAVVGKYAACIFHQGGHVCRLSPRRGSHVEDSLAFLRRERHDGEKR